VAGPDRRRGIGHVEADAPEQARGLPVHLRPGEGAGEDLVGDSRDLRPPGPGLGQERHVIGIVHGPDRVEAVIAGRREVVPG
jgi:hypothetical protein